jgi:hypothetical protein
MEWAPSRRSALRLRDLGELKCELGLPSRGNVFVKIIHAALCTLHFTLCALHELEYWPLSFLARRLPLTLSSIALDPAVPVIHTSTLGFVRLSQAGSPIYNTSLQPINRLETALPIGTERSMGCLLPPPPPAP